MNTKIFPIATAILIGSFATSVHAQFVVSDPTAESEDAGILTEGGTADTELGVIARATQETAATTADTLTMMNAPTTTVVGGFASIDAGGADEAATDSTDFLPVVNGAAATPAESAGLLAAVEAATTTDETEGLVDGDPASEEEARQRLISTNVQGQAYNDMLAYAARYAAADGLLPELSTANIKDAVVWGDGIQLQTLKQLNLLGVSISLNTAAVTENSLQEIKEYFQLQQDHQETAVELASAAAP
jgi:hypothetical protein